MPNIVISWAKYLIKKSFPLLLPIFDRFNLVYLPGPTSNKSLQLARAQSKLSVQKAHESAISISDALDTYATQISQIKQLDTIDIFSALAFTSDVTDSVCLNLSQLTHSLQAAHLCQYLPSLSEKEDFIIAALWHDVGKAYVNEFGLKILGANKIVNSTANYYTEKYSFTHSELAFLLAPSSFSDRTLALIRYHNLSSELILKDPSIDSEYAQEIIAFQKIDQLAKSFSGACMNYSEALKFISCL